VKRHASEHLFRKFLINDDQLGFEIRCNSRKARAVFGGLDLIVGIRKKCRNSAQHHRSGKDCHRGNTLRHDDDDPIASGCPLLVECRSLPTSKSPELGKGHRLLFILVNPESDERTLAGRGFERLDQIAVAKHETL
jgi:hypothetical protein